LTSAAWAAALNALFTDDQDEIRFLLSDAETETVCFLHPDEWPSTGQSQIHWDLSVQGREHTFSAPDKRILQPIDCEHFRPDVLVLGRALFSDLEPLLHPDFRHSSDTVWNLDIRKLSRAIYAVTPALSSRYNVKKQEVGMKLKMQDLRLFSSSSETIRVIHLISLTKRYQFFLKKMVPG
ncbi:hypothetical protein AGJ47_20875, partial [Cronobacter dublinensis subsp. dublinensis]|nr:hypothetical protein [Cronobacter dublinensis subsp. dublinensis]